jgi:uncharacterized protein
MARIVIAGGTGFLGQNLARHLLARGDQVVVLGRTRPATCHGEFVPWDGHSLGDWVRQLDSADAVVNFAGRTVDCIKTPDHQDEILRSRVEATRVLGRAVREVAAPPPVWLQMSTAHVYGDPPDRLCDEDSPHGFGLAPFVAEAWERAHREAVLPSMRTVVLRTSFVLGRRGGALPKLATVTRLFLGGRVGHGRQGISWIHEEDMNRLCARALDDASFGGVYVATAPEPVSNTAFMRALRAALGRPFGLPAPAFLVRLGAPLVLRTDPELALYGRYCRSRRLAEAGFEFEFPEVGAALRDLLARGR